MIDGNEFECIASRLGHNERSVATMFKVLPIFDGAKMYCPDEHAEQCQADDAEENSGFGIFIHLVIHARRGSDVLMMSNCSAHSREWGRYESSSHTPLP